MNAQTDHSVVTYWGGRPERYREFPRAQIRAHDTFGILPVQFAQAFHYEAWVLERFAASTKAITTKPTVVKAKVRSAERSLKITFAVTRRDDTVEYILLSKFEVSSVAFRDFQSIAAANNAIAVVRTRADVRARVEEFWWWENLRQVATVWVRRGEELDEPLITLVGSQRKSLAELCALVDAPSDLIRARLARLHVAGRLIITRAGSSLTVAAIDTIAEQR